MCMTWNGNAGRNLHNVKERKPNGVERIKSIRSHDKEDERRKTNRSVDSSLLDLK